jgi:hypothetical protein
LHTAQGILILIHITCGGATPPEEIYSVENFLLKIHRRDDADHRAKAIAIISTITASYRNAIPNYSALQYCFPFFFLRAY